ncbi:Disease resistance-like protein DSC1 [Linum grandiflorum]
MEWFHELLQGSVLGNWEYDVFVCFRGADTRRTFTSHLMSALSDKQIKSFIDDKLQKTECIDELLWILKRSALCIVIFSKTFPDSPWCLDEVATIVRGMEQFGHRALPVFYDVDPSDVTDDSGSYAHTIDHKLKAGPADTKRWKEALKVVANCAGHSSQSFDNDSALIMGIMEDVQKRLIEMSARVESVNLVGIDSRISKVVQLLAMEKLDETLVIGLWGMGGVGKTTLARTCYQRLITSSWTTQGINHHFVMNISDSFKTRCGGETMVKELYSKLLGENNLSFGDLDTGYRRERLQRSRVLVVLDDVETPSQMDQLLLGNMMSLTRLFAPGSRIIVTTRNRRVLDHAMAAIYKVEGLDSLEANQLFSLHAFRQQQTPFVDWMQRLSRLAISHCKGSPLAIKVVGGALFHRDERYWKSYLCKLGTIRNLEIHDVLRVSYNALGAEERKLFLDVACIFSPMDKTMLMNYVSISYPSVMLEDLMDKSLLFEQGDQFNVHDLLKEMAWNIVNEEPRLESRSRLKDPQDIRKLLTCPEVERSFWSRLFNAGEVRINAFGGCKATEGILLHLNKVKEMHLEAGVFEDMNSLTFLRFYSHPQLDGLTKIHLPDGGLSSLPNELRFLIWDGYPSKSLPSRFAPENLLILDLYHSPIQRCWEGVQPSLVNLIILDLSYCINLTGIPDVSRSRNLEKLCLQGCKSLTELPSHVQGLLKLISLVVKNCESLRLLPTKLDSKCLKYVYLSDCPKVIRCPEIDSTELEVLDLEGTPINSLPRSIYNVKQGGGLRLYGNHITSFPRISTSLQLFRLCNTIVNQIDFYGNYEQVSLELLPRFDRLELVNNIRLRNLPTSIWRMVKWGLQVEGSPLIESLPEIPRHPLLNHLTDLSISDCVNLKSIPPGIVNLKYLQHLSFAGTAIESLPSYIEELSQLCTLNLSCCTSLRFLPDDINKLANLSLLMLSYCHSIQRLPQLPPNLVHMDFGFCKLLQALPTNFPTLSWRHLHLEGCLQLDRNSLHQLLACFSYLPTMSQHPQVKLIYNGSEIPEWFDCRSVNA